MADRFPQKILVLDDDAGILRLSQRALERAGHSVITAETSSAAEAILSERPGFISLIVLDYQLGGVASGLDFFRSLASRGFAPPAVLATGFSDEGRVLEALRAGVRDVVRKSDDFLERLPRTIERILKEVDTERKAVEVEAVRENEQRLRLALETGGLGSWELDSNVLDLECSDICKQHFAVSGEGRIPYQMFLDAIHPEDRERVRSEFMRVAQERSEGDAEFRTVHADGTIRWIFARGRVTSGGPLRAARMIGVTQDVTARKLAEQELRSAKDAAEAANKAKDHFLAVLSHELRTPLTPVLAASHEMAADLSLPLRARETFGMIRRNIELETKLVDDLLDLTRVSRGKLSLAIRPTDLNDTIHSIIRMCEGELRGKGIRLTLDLGATQSTVMADAARLQQVFWNLVKNAVKFTPDGGAVSVCTQDASPGNVLVEVSDTGIGIAPDLLPRVFDAFEQGENSVTRQFGGLGLGLAISRALVALHGGKIWAHSDGRGHGAKFIVELPNAFVAAEPRIAAGHGVAPAQPPQGLSVLLVEDHFDTAVALARLLRIFGHDVRTADSVGAALQEVESHRFDLIVSDIGLPDGTGLDLMRQLRLRFPLRGIVLSGFGMEEDIRRSLDAGFSSHLTKPVSPDVLQAEIVRLMKEWPPTPRSDDNLAFERGSLGSR